MMDGASIIDRINKRGALIKVLDKPHLDLTTPIGRGFIDGCRPLNGGGLADRRNVDSHQAGVHRRAHLR